MLKYKEIKIAILNQGKRELNHLNLTIKNIPKIDSKIIIGYSNLSNYCRVIKDFDELRTKK